MWNGCSQPLVGAAPRGRAVHVRGARDRPRGQRRPDPGEPADQRRRHDPARHGHRRGPRPDARPDGSARSATPHHEQPLGAVQLHGRSATSRRRSSPSTSAASTAATRSMWLECTNPTMFSDLTTGLHTFEVRAIAGEAAGPDPTPARYTWRVGPDPDDPGGTPINCDEANVTLTAERRRLGRPGQPARELLVHDRARRPLRRDDPGHRHRSCTQNARAFFRFPLQSDAPDCELESATLRLHSGSPHRGPDPRGRPARGDLEGEHAHLGQPARPGRGRRRRDDRSRARATASSTSRRTSRRSSPASCRTTAGRSRTSTRATPRAATRPSSPGSSRRIRRR